MADEDVQGGPINEGEDQEVEAVDEGIEEKPSLEDKLKESIDVQVEDVGSLRKKLTITIPPETINEQLNEQYGELKREAMVPGFRKGRAPRRLLEKRFGHEVGETITQQLISGGYMAATDKTDLKVLGDPLIWATEKGAETQTLMDVQKAIELTEIPQEGPLVFSCEVEVQPEFDLPEIDGIELSKPVIEVTDEQIDEQIDRVRGMAGTYETVTDTAVEADDMVIADIKMTCGETVLKEESDKKLAARPQVVDGVTLEKLGDVLVGTKPGDTCSIAGEIPDTYAKEEYRGKQADFSFAIKQVQRLSLPDMDEAFFKRLGFENEKELRDWVKNDLESRLDEQVQQHLAGQVYAYLEQNASFELPERMSESQISQVVMRRMLEMYQQGVPPTEVEKRMDELKTSAREDALRDLKLAFVMEKLAEQCEVEVTEGEINSQIAGIAQRQGRRFDRVRDELHKQGAISNLYVRIRDEKIVKQLIEKAKITESKPEAKTAGAPADKKKKKTTKKAKAAKTATDKGDKTADKPAKPKRKPPKKD